MTVLEWNDRLNIGVENIDNAHRKLFSIMRRIIKLKDNPDNYKLLCEEGIKYFKSYTEKHFAEEEAYMRSIHYSGYEMHKRLHDNLRDKTLPVLEKEAAETNYSVESVERFIGICMAWLTQHIMSEDRAITGRVADRPITERPENETAALAEAVSRILKTFLGLDAETASEHYQGEPVGNLTFIRLLYKSANEKPVRISLGYEEKLILAAVSEMMGARVPKADKMALSCVMQLSQSLLKKLGQQFTYADACRLEKQNIVPYEIAQKTFQNEELTASILLRTQEGYFVFCVQA